LLVWLGVLAGSSHAPVLAAGACGGVLACSTCHVILEQKDFDRFDEPEEEELDMLDLAMGLKPT
jgi:2Fe-2S ferredoxin